MNAKAYKHIGKAYMYAKQPELGFGSDRIHWLVAETQTSQISIEDAKAFLHSARGSPERPEQRNVPAFLIACSAVFEYKTRMFKDSLSSEKNMSRALKAAMLISGMVAESEYRGHNPTHTTVNTFQHDGNVTQGIRTSYEYTLLVRNLRNLVELNTQPYAGEKLDERTANAMALELDRELLKLMHGITSEELKQVTGEDRYTLKLRCKLIFENCSEAYWKATVTQQPTADSVRQTNRHTASKRQRTTSSTQDS